MRFGFMGTGSGNAPGEVKMILAKMAPRVEPSYRAHVVKDHFQFWGVSSAGICAAGEHRSRTTEALTIIHVRRSYLHPRQA
jgi:hypothetical protein